MRVLFYFSLLFLFDSLLRFLLLCLRMIAPAWRRKSGTQTILGKKTRGCAVLIAAHDEAGTIGPTVAALQPHMPEWPGSSLYVVADRCTDATATEAAEAGALVAERTTGKLGKGAVIAWWLQEHSAAWQSKDAV
ncbi:MAG TPA: hypothetical protein PKD31_07455, partial [Blastocatellia bacterium]|nr:hypothetical protein [Blastocatellia bacterium]